MKPQLHYWLPLPFLLAVVALVVALGGGKLAGALLAVFVAGSIFGLAGVIHYQQVRARLLTELDHEPLPDEVYRMMNAHFRSSRG